MSGGVVGGLSSVATGSGFWQGFTQGGISAALSFAANQVAGAIKAHLEQNRKAQPSSDPSGNAAVKSGPEEGPPYNVVYDDCLLEDVLALSNGDAILQAYDVVRQYTDNHNTVGPGGAYPAEASVVVTEEGVVTTPAHGTKWRKSRTEGGSVPIKKVEAVVFKEIPRDSTSISVFNHSHPFGGARGEPTNPVDFDATQSLSVDLFNQGYGVDNMRMMVSSPDYLYLTPPKSDPSWRNLSPNSDVPMIIWRVKM